MSTVEIIEDMPIGEYHALPRLSNSGIGSLFKSPAHFKARKWGEPSKAMRIGSAVHTLVLEPHLAASMLPVAPEVNKRTKAGRAAWEAWTAGVSPQATLLDATERAVADKAAHAIRSHEEIQATGLLFGKVEHSILFEIEGCPAKARFDVFNKASIIVDLKTSRDASEFEKSVANFGYHTQAAFYTMAAHAAGWEPKAFLFVVVETSDEMMNSGDPSQFVRVVQLDDQAVLQGEKDVLRAAKLYRECLESGVWPGYSRGIDTLHLPIWAIDLED